MKQILFQGAALLCLPLVTIAQTSATDPVAPVPAVQYRSVFIDTPKGVEADSVNWTAANATVGQNLRGHMDILKWEAAQVKANAAQQSAPAGSVTDPGAAKP